MQGLHTGAELEFWPDSDKPIQQAATPPSSWYTQHSVAELERSRVFQRSWQVLETFISVILCRLQCPVLPGETVPLLSADDKQSAVQHSWRDTSASWRL